MANNYSLIITLLITFNMQLRWNIDTTSNQAYIMLTNPFELSG